MSEQAKNVQVEDILDQSENSGQLTLPVATTQHHPALLLEDQDAATGISSASKANTATQTETSSKDFTENTAYVRGYNDAVIDFALTVSFGKGTWVEVAGVKKEEIAADEKAEFGLLLNYQYMAEQKMKKWSCRLVRLPMDMHDVKNGKKDQDLNQDEKAEIARISKKMVKSLHKLEEWEEECVQCLKEICEFRGKWSGDFLENALKEFAGRVAGGALHDALEELKKEGRYDTKSASRDYPVPCSTRKDILADQKQLLGCIETTEYRVKKETRDLILLEDRLKSRARTKEGTAKHDSAWFMEAKRKDIAEFIDWEKNLLQTAKYHYFRYQEELADLRGETWTDQQTTQKEQEWQTEGLEAAQKEQAIREVFQQVVQKELATMRTLDERFLLPPTSLSDEVVPDNKAEYSELITEQKRRAVELNAHYQIAARRNLETQRLREHFKNHPQDNEAGAAANKAYKSWIEAAKAYTRLQADYAWYEERAYELHGLRRTLARGRELEKFWTLKRDQAEQRMKNGNDTEKDEEIDYAKAISFRAETQDPQAAIDNLFSCQSELHNSMEESDEGHKDSVEYNTLHLAMKHVIHELSERSKLLGLKSKTAVNNYCEVYLKLAEENSPAEGKEYDAEKRGKVVESLREAMAVADRKKLQEGAEYIGKCSEARQHMGAREPPSCF
ncbi:hypothetical protein B0J14DRAFT_638838 [Halenospora varia]|nr:hypothetical protein B0J14DRAFT_638838 [Halenospora varia]